MTDFPYGLPPRCLLEESFTVPTGDCGAALKLALPALTGRFQEIAGRHAHALGCGIQALQAEGLTWMLGRLSLRIEALPEWRDTVRLRTWPSGLRGRLAAERQFVLEDVRGCPLVSASSEWLCVSLASGRLARIPEGVRDLADPGTAAFGLCRDRLPAPPTSDETAAETGFSVRRADIDFNRHVNNVCYTVWMLETLPEHLYFSAEPRSFDIEYRRAARLGDAVRSRTLRAPDGTWHHSITAADGTEFARAVSSWALPQP